MKANEDIIIHGRSLKDILWLHELFLTTGGKEGEWASLEGVNLRYANLKEADLRYVNLRYANLRYANLKEADLRYVNLRYANLKKADLRGANLLGADLRGANLKEADLRGANLYDANLSGADLIEADLRYVDLRYANLKEADLRGANLYDANLSEAKLENVKYNHTTLFYTLQCPEKGSFIGYKKAGKCRIDLKILDDSKRSSATTRKCRCDKALVLDIENIETGEKVSEVPSNRDKDFIYKVGEVVSVDDFDEDRWVECTTGIHFFMIKHEAESYIR